MFLHFFIIMWKYISMKLNKIIYYSSTNDEVISFKNKEKFIDKNYKYSTIKDELEELIVKEIGRGGYLGYCHLYWATKKRILKEKYSLDWKSPAELNPHILYD